MELNIERIALLLLVVAAVSMLGRKLRLPYTVGLVLTGVALALSPLSLNIRLTKALIFTAFLPPLIFEAALQSPGENCGGTCLLSSFLARSAYFWRRASLPQVCICCGLAMGNRATVGRPLAATDPVSVIATFKEAGVEGRLRFLVEAESLFNDGTAAVLFGRGAGGNSGDRTDVPGVTQSFCVTVFGGVVCGAVVGGAALCWQEAPRTIWSRLPLPWLPLRLVPAAEHLHLSGVVATLMAGILLGNYGSCGPMTEKGRAEVVAFWDYIAFVVNSLIFLLIGIRLRITILLRAASHSCRYRARDPGPRSTTTAPPSLPCCPSIRRSGS